MRQRIKCFNRSTWVMLLVMLVFIVSTKWIRINVQPSVAMGVYMVQALPRTLERGMLVVLPTPAVMRPWHSRDLLKPVAGVAQDQVCLLSVGLWINGEPYGGIYTEAYGNPLPRLRGCFVVPEGAVFVASKERNSIDSRYFGPVRRADLAAQAVPLWTW